MYSITGSATSDNGASISYTTPAPFPRPNGRCTVSAPAAATLADGSEAARGDPSPSVDLLIFCTACGVIPCSML